MARIIAAVAILCAMASPVLATRGRLTCVAVAIEGIPSLVCARPARRR